MATNSKKAFLDATFLFAFIDRSDQNHQKTARMMDSLAQSGASLYTSLQSVSETYATLAQEVGLSVALEFLEAMSASTIEILYPQKPDLVSALKILRSNRDKQISLREAINATLMEKRDISQILTHTYWHGLYGTTASQQIT